MKHKYDMTGKRSGALTFESFSHADKFGKSVWNVRCDCGVVKKARADRLGILQSCGCQTKAITHGKLYKGCGQLSGRYWCRVRHNAKSRGIKFRLTIQQAHEIFNGRCALSGVTIELDKDASLDRMDSSLGYEVGNIQWVHKTINQMKNQLSEPQFLDWVSKVAHFKKL